MKQTNLLKCTVTSPKGTKRYQNIKSVTLPAFFGQAQIFPGHAESFFLLEQGNLVFQYSNKQTESLQITTGECYVAGNTVVIVL